jgi:hypothetical protein
MCVCCDVLGVEDMYTDCIPFANAQYIYFLPTGLLFRIYKMNIAHAYKYRLHTHTLSLNFLTHTRLLTSHSRQKRNEVVGCLLVSSLSQSCSKNNYLCPHVSLLVFLAESEDCKYMRLCLKKKRELGIACNSTRCDFKRIS